MEREMDIDTKDERGLTMLHMLLYAYDGKKVLYESDDPTNLLRMMDILLDDVAINDAGYGQNSNTKLKRERNEEEPKEPNSKRFKP